MTALAGVMNEQTDFLPFFFFLFAFASEELSNVCMGPTMWMEYRAWCRCLPPSIGITRSEHQKPRHNHRKGTSQSPIIIAYAERLQTHVDDVGVLWKQPNNIILAGLAQSKEHSEYPLGTPKSARKENTSFHASIDWKGPPGIYKLPWRHRDSVVVAYRTHPPPKWATWLPSSRKHRICQAPQRQHTGGPGTGCSPFLVIEMWRSWARMKTKARSAGNLAV